MSSTRSAGERPRTVLITGCSAGFGRALVPEFLSRGWVVIATLREAEKRRSVFEAELRQYRDNLQLFSLDVTQAGDRERVARFVDERFSGRLDLLINNAGYGVTGALEDLSEAQIRYQMEVNFFGVVFLTRTLLPALRAAEGRLIHISSVLGFASLPLYSMYCASKHALEGLAESMDHELRVVGVQTALVEPGSFKTDFLDHQVWGERSRAADSPYFGLTRKVEDYMKGRPASIFGDPRKVVHAIVKLAEADEMPFRVAIGRDAWIVRILRHFLPRNLLIPLLRSVFRRMIFGG